MQENINYTELEQTLNNIKNLTEKVNKNLYTINNQIEENIASGEGIWDSQLASNYKKRWQNITEEFPKIIDTFMIQEKNLELYINSMKNVD